MNTEEAWMSSWYRDSQLLGVQTRWDSVAFSLHDFGGAASVDSSFPLLSLWNLSLFIQLKAFTVGEQRSLLAGHCGMAYLKMEISTSRAWISCLRMSLFR